MDDSTAVRVFSVNLHASQEPHFCVEIGSLNFLLIDIWLSVSFVHACDALRVVFFVLLSNIAGFWISGSTDDQIGVQMETLLGSSRRYVPKGLPGGKGNRKMTTRATSTAKKARTATGHARSPERQLLRVYKQLRTTGGEPHSNYQLLVGVPLCRNRLGNRSGDTKCANKALETYRNSRKCSISGTLGRTCASENPCLASFPSDYFCRSLTRRSYLSTRKTSRPCGTVFQLG